jgi:hypothetical protein
MRPAGECLLWQAIQKSDQVAKSFSGRERTQDTERIDRGSAATYSANYKSDAIGGTRGESDCHVSFGLDELANLTEIARLPFCRVDNGVFQRRIDVCQGHQGERRLSLCRRLHNRTDYPSRHRILNGTRH